MIHYFKIIRPLNLLIILVTFFVLGCYFDFCYFGKEFSLFYSFSIDFFLFALSIVLAAAGGNVINDYLDEETDKINRPQKLIISRFISKSNVLIYYVLLNTVALFFGFYVGIKLHFYWIIGFVVLTIFLLFLYSKYFKKAPFIGNFVVALLVAFVPYWTALFYQTSLSFHFPLSTYPFEISNSSVFPIYVGLFFAFFALLLNGIREFVKDIEDRNGDQKIGAETLPLLLGIEKSIIFAKFLLIFFLLVGFILFIFLNRFVLHWYSFLPYFLSLGCVSFSLKFLFTPFSIKKIKMVSLLLKIAMILGVLMPLYWLFLMKL